MGANQSSNYVSQNAEANIAQTFSGTCSISCQNQLSNANIVCENCNIGGNITVSQACSSDGQCIINSSMTALEDILLKAQQSANAESILQLIPSVNSSNNTVIQNILENIYQSTTESCNINSVNQANNVNIFAENANIGGSIQIAQSGSTYGNCQLNSMMNATAIGTAQSDQCASSGKSLIKCSSGTNWISILVIAVIVIVVLIGGYILAKYLSKRSQRKNAANVNATPNRSLGAPPPPPSMRAPQTPALPPPAPGYSV